MSVHRLKTLKEYFQAVKNGVKTFECRFNDRNFQIDDTLVLSEIEYKGDNILFTGDTICCRVTYILDNFTGLTDGFVILGISKICCADAQLKRYIEIMNSNKI